MEKWTVTAKRADFDKWAKEFQISPVLARILRNRDLETEEEIRLFLNGTLKDCHDPKLMKDMTKAANIILQAISDGLKIRVIGDYDVDGICSSYILTKGFRMLGGCADVAIPHRIHDGYGLSEQLIRDAKDEGIEMIVTCDNGISAAEQIALAGELGIRVVVTDHHEVPYEEENGMHIEILPGAEAVVDPKRQDCEYPFKQICGGVVAYKLICCMVDLRKKEESNGDIQEKNIQNMLEEFLEFAALSTVCDVTELKDENRIYVKEGIKRMKQGLNPGLEALIRINELEPEKISPYHLGFVLGPCMNATGRLDTAGKALELLFAPNIEAAMPLANNLKELNQSRKNMTVEGVAEAMEYIQENGLEQDDVWVIYLPDVHESLAGIIAGRVREKANHPVFVLTQGQEGIKGSGRSIEAYHMYEALNEVKDLLAKYGGHKLAAGLSLASADVDGFRKALNAHSTLQKEDFVEKVKIDVPMPVNYATEELARQMEKLEPYGVGNPKPLFAQKDLLFVEGVRMGANKTAARFRVVTPEGESKQVLYFGDQEKFAEFLIEQYGEDSVIRLFSGTGRYKISITYQLGLNTYRGNTQTQLIMQNFCRS